MISLVSPMTHLSRLIIINAVTFTTKFISNGKAYIVPADHFLITSGEDYKACQPPVYLQYEISVCKQLKPGGKGTQGGHHFV